MVCSFRISSKVLTRAPDLSAKEVIEEENEVEVEGEEEKDKEDEEEDEEEEDGSSLTIEVTPGPGEGLSTGRKEKPGESRLEHDSGVPTELIVGWRLDIATSNLNKKNIMDIGDCKTFLL